MTPSIVLFQATATAIPTLLVALAVGLKRGESLLNSDDGGVGALFKAISLAIAAMVVGGGFWHSLYSLISGAGGPESALWAIVGVLTVFGVVLFELFRPMMAWLPFPSFTYSITLTLYIAVNVAFASAYLGIRFVPDSFDFIQA